MLEVSKKKTDEAHRVHRFPPCGTLRGTLRGTLPSAVGHGGHDVGHGTGGQGLPARPVTVASGLRGDASLGWGASPGGCVRTSSFILQAMMSYVTFWGASCKKNSKGGNGWTRWSDTSQIDSEHVILHSLRSQSESY